MLPSEVGQSVSDASNVLENIYIVCLFLLLIVSITVNVNISGLYYKISIVILGLFLLLALAASLSYVMGENTSILVKMFMFLSVGSYIIPIILNICSIDIIPTVMGLISYLFLAPTYVNLFVIYAFANIHDVSWGNRPSTQG